MTTPEIKPEWVEAFRAAWLTAGVRGHPEHRIEAGLTAVAPLIAAQALRDAAEPWQLVTGSDTPMIYPAVSDWLCERADRAEAGRVDQ